MRIGSGFSYRFFGSFRRFNGDLDNDLPHRPALAAAMHGACASCGKRIANRPPLSGSFAVSPS